MRLYTAVPGFFNKIQKKALVLVFLLPFLMFSFFILVSAEDAFEDGDLEKYEKEIKKFEEKYESTSSKLSKIQEEKNKINSTIAELSGQSNITNEQINDVQNEINQMNTRLEEIKKNLSNKKDILVEKTNLRNKVLRGYYQTGLLNPVETFLFKFSVASEELPKTSFGQPIDGFQFNTFSSMFSSRLSSETMRLIIALNIEIDNFERDKAAAEEIKNALEDSQSRLVALKQQLDAQVAAARSEAANLASQESSYQSELVSIKAYLDKLNEKQQSILRDKFGDDIVTVGSYEAPKYNLPDPPFKPAFAAFSYGAYTHYNGMSQYGAKGRAEAGQNYEEILKFYYKTGVKKKDDFPDKIEVQGYGKLDFQYYLYGLAEMHSYWPLEALKAQAIAARTYAYRAKKPICTSDKCQVFLKSKADKPPPRWVQAVDETRDLILDNPSTAQYSSTTGGYINNVGWDKDGKWPNKAYEKLAGSPWFYKAWYTKTYDPNSSTCGRAHPWLNEEEMADILNAWVVWKKGSSSDRDRVTPVTTSCWGGNPYSNDAMAERAEELDKKYEKISDIDVIISNSGKTSKVRFDTDRGKLEIDGVEFKTVFNLRAPAYIAIKSRLYDLEIRD
mgnify:CR=1 FL=1